MTQTTRKPITRNSLGWRPTQRRRPGAASSCTRSPLALLTQSDDDGGIMPAQMSLQLMPAYFESPQLRINKNAVPTAADPLASLNAKLKGLRNRQADMVRVNELVMQHDRRGLSLIGYSDEGIENLFTPDSSGRTGYTPEQIEALTVEIERIQQRINAIERGGNAAPAMRPNPSTWLHVRQVPTAQTIWDAVTPALGDIEQLAETLLLRAWKYAAAAQHMMRRSIEPRSYHHRRQHHMLHQCADSTLFARIEAEVKRRGLLAQYGIEIGFSS